MRCCKAGRPPPLEMPPAYTPQPPPHPLTPPPPNIKPAPTPHQVYTVTLHGEQLRTDFRVINNDDKPFSFTAALHTYFEVGALLAALSSCRKPQACTPIKPTLNPMQPTDPNQLQPTPTDSNRLHATPGAARRQGQGQRPQGPDLPGQVPGPQEPRQEDVSV
jgi:hypothetical protein